MDRNNKQTDKNDMKAFAYLRKQELERIWATPNHTISSSSTNFPYESRITEAETPLALLDSHAMAFHVVFLISAV
jgi:hypothetical protein